MAAAGAQGKDIEGGLPGRPGSTQPQGRNSGPDNTLDHAMQQLYVSSSTGQSGEDEQAPRTLNGPQFGNLRQSRTGQIQSSNGPASSANMVPIDPNTGQPMAGYHRSNTAPMQSYVPIDGNQPQGPAGNSAASQQTTYYMQPPMYIDQNGQPMYYRVPGAPFQQEIMYTTNPDGTAGEPMMAYMHPYQSNGQPHMPPQGYWPPHGGPNEHGYGGPPPPEQMASNGGMRRGGYGHHGGPQYGPGRGYGQNDGRRMGNEDRRGYHGDREGRGGQRHNNNRNMNAGGNGYMPGALPSRSNMEGQAQGGFNPNRAGYNANANANANVNIVRDPVVEEFRSSYGKSRQWELVDLIGHVVPFCQDQHGSRFIQQRLEICTDVDKQLIFDEVLPQMNTLMTDVFGNYVLQKLFEFGTPDQVESLAQLLQGQAVQLSMQMYGCRVVQKALEYVGTNRLIALVAEFEGLQTLLRCVHDANGNHVIQKCIEVVSRVSKEASSPEFADYMSSRIMFIINTFQGHIRELSSHPYGCRVIQRLLEHCSNPQKAIVLEELRKCCADLVQDCYGNYVIQYVMQHGWEPDRAVLMKEVQAHLLDFATHKFASNVVEKCLQYAHKRDKDEMIWTIINVTFDLNQPVDSKTGHCVLENMVRDPYANYVVQKVIEVSDERQRAAIVRYVRENIVQLRRYTYGKHIIVRLENITNEKF